MTAFQKQDGGVRGIATGTSFRGLVAKTLASQFEKPVEAVCAPYQFAFSTPAGTDCVEHAIMAFTDADPQCTVLFIGGVGANDHVLRSSFLAKSHGMPSLQGLLPFVRSVYARPTTHVWEDGTGVRHQIHQAEGSEQGDPLIPLLFSLGIHDSLCSMDERLRSVEDAWRLQHLGRAQEQGSSSTRAKLECGTAQERVAELEDEVWNPTGIKMLGTPIGSP